MKTTASAVGLPFDEAIAFLRQKANVTTRHWTDVWQEGHSRAFMVAGAASEALVQDFRDAVAKALEQGTTLAEFRRDFDAIVAKHGWVHNGTPGWRSQIIFETNLATAYSAGRYAQMTEPATLEAFPYWRYQHNAAVHPRVQHVAWDGLTLSADDPWWSTHYPPNGWRCHCSVEPVSSRGLGRMGKSGPDTAPPLDSRPWRNPRTGEVVQVPKGIDPGFAYNPGQAWQRGTVPPGQGGPPAAPGGLPAMRPGARNAPMKGPGQTVVEHVFPSVEEADRTLTAAMQPWADTLSEDESGALDAYKGGIGRPLNAVLRGEGDPLGVGRFIAPLAQAIGRAAMPESVRVFRGLGANEAALLAAAKAGDVLSSPAFTSTTLSPEVARKLGDEGLVAEILVGRGTRGVAYIHPFPRYRYRQYEVLMTPGMRLRVLAMEQGRVVLEALDDGPGSDDGGE